MLRLCRVQANGVLLASDGFESFLLNMLSARKLNGGNLPKRSLLTKLAYEFRIDKAAHQS